MFYYVPKRLRAKLSHRWRLGTYLGMASSSNEHYVATRQGNVVKVRSVCRVVEASRWSATAILNIKGTPSKLCPIGDEDIHADIENAEQPHIDMAEAARQQVEAQLEEEKTEKDNLGNYDHRLKITDKDLRLYGFSDNCARCSDLQRGKRHPFRPHTDECKLRIYLSWKDHDSNRYKGVKHIIEPDARDEPAGHVAIDELQHDRPVIQGPSVPTPTGPPVPLTPHGRPWEQQHRTDDDGLVSDDGRWNSELVEPEFLGVDISGPPPSPIPARIDQDYGDSDDDMGDAADGESMVEYLVLTGADPTEARSKVYSMLGKRPTTFMEVYGRGAINETANKARRNLDLKGLGALDLRTTKASGEPWNFNLRSDRREARELIDQRQPDWLIGSPPCTAFSIWNYAMNYPKMSKDKVQIALAEGRTHLAFMASLYRKQILRGKYFLHEHPATALSWKEDAITQLSKLPSVYTTVADQCMYGLTSPTGADGTERLPSMKPTRFMTNSIHMQAKLSTRCDRSHKHQQLVGGRCAEAAFYPLGLIKAILSGMQATTQADQLQDQMHEERKALLAAITDSAGKIPVETDSDVGPPSSLKRVAGGILPVGYHPQNFRAKYVDEYTGEILDPLLVRAAIMEELNYFNDKVWEIETIDRMKEIKDHVHVQSRWVLCNKGDGANPDI